DARVAHVTRCVDHGFDNHHTHDLGGHGFLGVDRTSLILVGTLMLPPTRTGAWPSAVRSVLVSPPGGGGGGGGGMVPLPERVCCSCRARLRSWSASAVNCCCRVASVSI